LKGFCTGTEKDPVTREVMNFKPIRSISDCINFAETKNYTFESGLRECENTALDRGDCDGNCDKTKSIKIPTSDGDSSVEEACRHACGWCGPTNKKPSGCALGVDNTVRFYAPADPMPHWVAYTAVCAIHRCSGTDEIVSEASIDNEPMCGRGQTYETETYRMFYYVTGSCIVFIVCLAYCCGLNGACNNAPDGTPDDGDPLSPIDGGKPLCCNPIPSSVHKLIWIGLVCRVTDLATDWAFWNININGDRFKFAVEESGNLPFPYDTFVLGALVICIMSSALTPIDILSKLPACGRDRKTGDDNEGLSVMCCKLGRKTSIIIGTLIIVLEDMPQIAVTLLYVREMEVLSDDASAEETALTIFNLALSGISVLANFLIVVNGFCSWKTKTETIENLEKRLANKKKHTARKAGQPAAKYLPHAGREGPTTPNKTDPSGGATILTDEYIDVTVL
jgi:hypothetical protein